MLPCSAPPSFEEDRAVRARLWDLAERTHRLARWVGTPAESLDRLAVILFDLAPGLTMESHQRVALPASNP